LSFEELGISPNSRHHIFGSSSSLSPQQLSASHTHTTPTSSDQNDASDGRSTDDELAYTTPNHKSRRKQNVERWSVKLGMSKLEKQRMDNYITFHAENKGKPLHQRVKRRWVLGMTPEQRAAIIRDPHWNTVDLSSKEPLVAAEYPVLEKPILKAFADRVLLAKERYLDGKRSQYALRRRIIEALTDEEKRIVLFGSSKRKQELVDMIAPRYEMVSERTEELRGRELNASHISGRREHTPG
jgi:hypothetical protein